MPTKQRKQRPGPCPKRGRPATAQKRAKERARRQSERSLLRSVGFEEVTVIVPVDEAAHLRRRSKINRLDGRIRAAQERGDTLEVRRLEAARGIEIRDQEAQLIAEAEAELRAKAEEQAELRRIAQEAAQRHHQRSAEIEPILQTAKPDWMI